MNTHDRPGLGTSSRDQGNELLQLVSFMLGREEYGIDILRVQEIKRMAEITRVPNAPAFVSGVMNLRGKVIPIVDLRSRFRLERREDGKETRIIVVDLQGRTIGIVVDAVRQVLRIPRSVTEPPPSVVAGIGSEFISAVGKLEDRLLILLDIDRILTSAEVEQADPVVH